LKQVPFLVTDNGNGFLSKRFQKDIQGRFQHVRTGYRTAEQLGLLERCHQTLKREEVYWQLYDHPPDAREKLEAFRCRYVRLHWALVPKDGGDALTPLYHGGAEIEPPQEGLGQGGPSQTGGDDGQGRGM
jgi:transposase InsO family protein